MMGVRKLSTLCLVLTTLLSHCLTRATAEILVHPTSQTICRGENGTLACRVRGIGGWRINQTTLVPSNQALFRARGFTAEVNESRGREENEIFTTLTMVVEGRVQNNNTRFICYSVSVDGEVSVSNGAFLVIAGYPLPPSPALLITNSTTIQVSWERPFAMREVADILFYTVRMYNSSSQGIKEWRIRSLPQTNTYTHNITVTEVAKECIPLSFEVRAANRVGNSSAGFTSGGFPIVPYAIVMNPIEAILETSVTGGLMAEIVLWSPHICPYQETRYSLIAKTVPAGEVVHSRTLSLSPLNQNQSITVVLDGLKSNVSYQFSYLVQSVTGEVMFSAMTTYAAAGDTFSIGCISVLTDSLLTVFCTPSDASKLISYNCSIDGGSFQPCTPPMNILLPSLPAGQHALQISGYSTTLYTFMKTIPFSVNPLQIRCQGNPEKGLFILQCTSNRPISKFLCSIDGEKSGSCYVPIRLAEYTNRSHLLLVQGYSEQGELSVTSLNFTGTLGSQEVKFTHNSPILVGRNLTVFVDTSKYYDSVMCEVHMFTAEVSHQDCSSGSADFNNLPEGEAVIRLSAKIGGDEVASTKSRVWVYNDPEFCAPYLVNDMITIEDDAVRVTFGSSGKPNGFACSLDSSKPFSCSSPVFLTGLHKGKYVLHIRPEQCNSYQTSSFSFEI